ncbi:expressed unknown protein [Seminavis robusta]|uniref:Uncharacterized protein n=1 Tax=Seminavis robusta TaxID=568900 RepID=A0A9N8E9N0_9STRA|nr:expressed unknown protein [Seminavis robusta]|eukprot:Sro850_g210670.1 n/a (227) ;mRNA; f:21587-22267
MRRMDPPVVSAQLVRDLSNLQVNQRGRDPPAAARIIHEEERKQEEQEEQAANEETIHDGNNKAGSILSVPDSPGRGVKTPLEGDVGADPLEGMPPRKLSVRRRFSGYMCLVHQVGNDGKKKAYDRDAILCVWKKWAMGRMAQKKPYVGIMVAHTTEQLCEGGPAVKVQGELNASHDGMSDEETIATLKSMFCYVAMVLKQTQVEFKFYGEEDNYLCHYNVHRAKRR